MGTIGVLMGSGGRRGPKNDKYCTQMGLQWERTENMNQICRYDLFFGWLAGQVMKLGLQGQMGTFGVLMGSEGGGKWSIWGLKNEKKWKK